MATAMFQVISQLVCKRSRKGINVAVAVDYRKQMVLFNRMLLKDGQNLPDTH